MRSHEHRRGEHSPELRLQQESAEDRARGGRPSVSHGEREPADEREEHAGQLADRDEARERERTQHDRAIDNGDAGRTAAGRAPAPRDAERRRGERHDRPEQRGEVERQERQRRERDGGPVRIGERPRTRWRHESARDHVRLVRGERHPDRGVVRIGVQEDRPAAVVEAPDVVEPVMASDLPGARRRDGDEQRERDQAGGASSHNVARCGGVRPRCAYARSVATRPRGVRCRKPSCSR